MPLYEFGIYSRLTWRFIPMCDLTLANNVSFDTSQYEYMKRSVKQSLRASWKSALPITGWAAYPVNLNLKPWKKHEATLRKCKQYIQAVRLWQLLSCLMNDSIIFFIPYGQKLSSVFVTSSYKLSVKQLFSS